jgi:hypothetical protein
MLPTSNILVYLKHTHIFIISSWLMYWNFTKENGHPHLPDPTLLDLLHNCETANVSGSKMAAKTTKASKDPGNEPKPTQLAWYGSCWKHFLKGAKGECHVLHALENPFPSLVPDLLASIMESLSASLIEWLKDGNQVEAGMLSLAF